MVRCLRPLAVAMTATVLLSCWVPARCDEAPAYGGKAVKSAAPPAGKGADEKSKSQYLRLVRDESGKPVAMEVAIVRFVPRDCGQTKPTVDLVGAVHIGDRSYYQQLNREFADYDAVLYELVAPPGTKIPEGGVKRGGNMLSSVQLGLKDLLELEFQLNAVRYDRANMVHADMSPEQFAKSMKDKNESVLSMFLRMMTYAMAKQNQSQGNEWDVLAALFDKNRALSLKRIMAEQFEDMEGSLGALNGPDGSTLISERNKVALGVLKQQIAAGKQKLAIFYGAGHMPDMEQRLRDDFDLAPLETRWVRAWDMKTPPEKPRPKPSVGNKSERQSAQ